MKKIFTYCCALLLAGGASGVAAETVLVNEDFESRIFPAEGWNIIDNHTEGIDEETGNPNSILLMVHGICMSTSRQEHLQVMPMCR